jgi:hypothetical protein
MGEEKENSSHKVKISCISKRMSQARQNNDLRIKQILMMGDNTVI